MSWPRTTWHTWWEDKDHWGGNWQTSVLLFCRILVAPAELPVQLELCRGSSRRLKVSLQPKYNTTGKPQLCQQLHGPGFSPFLKIKAASTLTTPLWERWLYKMVCCGLTWSVGKIPNLGVLTARNTSFYPQRGNYVTITGPHFCSN